MAITLAKIEEIAPDQASLAAARKLLAPKGWPNLAGDDRGLVWGECQGSGSLPYRVALSEDDLGYKCTCPSRKLPCKHVLALMWMRADGRQFERGERPDWVDAWLTRRRKPDVRRDAQTNDDEPRPRLSIADTAEPDYAGTEPKVLARAAAQRERNRAEREATILAALDELDEWIGDQIERGLASFQAIASEQCRLLARRLVDAKAGGLAGRVDSIPSTLFSLPDASRPEFLIEALGELHLVAEAYRRQADLPDGLRADVRSVVGWITSREELLADPQAPRIRGRWMVLAVTSEVQPDKLRRTEVWLARCGEAEQLAVLVDFVPVSLAATRPYAPGESFEAELAFYPSATPLRAIVTERTGSATKEERWSTPACDVATAIARYQTALATRPWLGRWPMAIGHAIVTREHDRLHLTHAEGGMALPIRTTEDDMALPLVGVDNIDAFGLWDGRQLDLRFAETPLGRWRAA